MKNEFQQILNKKLGVVENASRKTVSITPPKNSFLSADLLLSLKPKVISLNSEHPYAAFHNHREPVALSKEKTEAINKTEAIGTFVNNEVVRSAKIFFASIESPIPQQMSLEDLKRLFRLKAKDLHPDMQNGNPENFRLLKESYEALKSNWKKLEELAPAA